jgi:hypothetical protein
LCEEEDEEDEEEEEEEEEEDGLRRILVPLPPTLFATLFVLEKFSLIFYHV